MPIRNKLFSQVMTDLKLFSKSKEIIKMKLRSYMFVCELISELIKIWMGKCFDSFQAFRRTIDEKFINEIDK